MAQTRCNAKRRQPFASSITEYSSMFSLRDSLARHCATFARRRRHAASVRAFFFFSFYIPSPSRHLLHSFSSVSAPILYDVARRFEIKRQPALVSAHQAAESGGEGGGGGVRASIASGFPSPCSARHPVQWTIQFLGTVCSCAPPYLATYPNVTDDYHEHEPNRAAALFAL